MEEKLKVSRQQLKSTRVDCVMVETKSFLWGDNPATVCSFCDDNHGKTPNFRNSLGGSERAGEGKEEEKKCEVLVKVSSGGALF